MIDNKTLQRFLTKSGVQTKPDGVFGPKSITNARFLLNRRGLLESYWSDSRVKIAICQLMFKINGLPVGKIDGLYGPNTEYCCEIYQDYSRKTGSPHADGSSMFCRQSEVEQYYGKPGDNLQRFELPYQMRLAWDIDTNITTTRLHSTVVPSVVKSFTEVLDHYGLVRIRQLGLDLFAGGYNLRTMKGNKKSLSMHSWGIALDMDSENNRFRQDNTQASMAQPEYDAWWEIWENNGWTSLGRERNFDWMHLQACSL